MVKSKEDLKLGQIVKVKRKDSKEECVGFVAKLTDRRFYIDWKNRGKTLLHPNQWFYYEEVDVKIIE